MPQINEGLIILSGYSNDGSVWITDGVLNLGTIKHKYIPNISERQSYGLLYVENVPNGALLTGYWNINGKILNGISIAVFI